MFTDAVRFLQKAEVFHPEKPSILLLKRSAKDTYRPGAWDFPGGNVEWGELHGEALAREVLEETGLRVEQFTPLKVMSAFDPGENVYILHIIYTCKAVSTDVVLSSEHDTYGWFGKPELETLPSSSMYVALGLEALLTN